MNFEHLLFLFGCCGLLSMSWAEISYMLSEGNFDELCVGFEDKKGQSHAKEEFPV